MKGMMTTMRQVKLLLVLLSAALPSVKSSSGTFGIKSSLQAPQEVGKRQFPYSSKGQLVGRVNDDKHSALWVRGGAGCDVHCITSHVAAATWMLHGLSESLAPIETMKLGGVLIRPDSVGHVSTELTGWVLISLSILMLLTTHFASSFTIKKALVLSYLPLDLYCLFNKKRLNNLGVSGPMLLAGVAFDWLIALAVWTELVPIPNWLLYGSFCFLAVAGLLFPKQLASCCSLKLIHSSDTFSWSLIFYSFAMYATAITTFLLGGTADDAVRNTLAAALAGNLVARVDKKFYEAGFSVVHQNGSLIYILGLLGLLVWNKKVA